MATYEELVIKVKAYYSRALHETSKSDYCLVIAEHLSNMDPYLFTDKLAEDPDLEMANDICDFICTCHSESGYDSLSWDKRARSYLCRTLVLHFDGDLCMSGMLFSYMWFLDEELRFLAQVSFGSTRANNYRSSVLSGREDIIS